ncbi:MAG: helix-turn-helix domain-containing protein [Acidobacteria bacterium]|nr:helix-turn-helix domain-containing protein [Acidobacteriota bacterium]
MHYQEFPPQSDLAPFVRCYWTLAGQAAGCATERIVPDGRQELVFHLADPFHRVHLQHSERQPQALFTGQMDSPLFLRTDGAADVFGVCFHPGGLAPFCRFSQVEVAAAIHPLEDIWGSEARQLDETIRNAKNHAHRMNLVAAFLRRRLHQPERFGALACAVRAIQSEPATRVADIARSMGCSSRHLERLFTRHVGLSPKTLARICRFQRILQTREARPHLAWASSAVDCGYYDQAHLIADYRQFTGTTPVWHQREISQMERVFLRLV